MNKVQQIQQIIGVEADGLWGKKSQYYLDLLVEPYRVNEITGEIESKDRRRTRIWVNNNRSRSIEIKREYKLRNRDLVLKKERERQQAKRLSISDEKRQILRDYAKSYHNRRYKESLGYRVLVNLRARLYKALKGISKCSRTVHLLGCSIDSFKVYIESKFDPGMSWDNYGEWHIDHIVPCAIFDFSIESHQRSCFHFSNMQPLWARENILKGAKHDQNSEY